MRNKVIIILLGIVFISILIFNIYSNNKISYFTINGVKLAVGVDGVNQSDFPSMGEYNVSVDCTGVSGTWNYSNWELELSNITSNSASCSISFTSDPNTHTKLNTKIIGLSGTTQGDGQVVNEKGYRYEGKNPNNYVLFNGELWRIIGVFDSNTHGKSGQNLTKIIREESIGSYAWNKSNTNNWTDSSLKTILNDYYYNASSTGVDECYFYSTTVPGNCDFTKTGLNETSRSMIENVTWHLGGHSTQSATASTFYTAERGTTVYGSNSTTTTGYIGLMYPSDYGYSVLASSCARTTNLSSYNRSSCGGQSWLLKNGYEWTMTHKTSFSNSVFIVYYNANLSYDSANNGSAVRPTAYLKSNVYVISGTGSITDPYVIGI